MKILYCNLRAKWTVMGHRYFDVKWSHLLSNAAEVTLLCPEETWYSGVEKQICTEVYNATEKLDRKSFLNWPIWSKGVFRRLCIKDHMEVILYMKKIIELDQKNHYDYILIATIDLISYYFLRHKFKRMGKLFLLDQSVSAYETGILGRLFEPIKNDFKHIVMERDGIEYMNNQYHIDKNRIYYIPHMLNPISIQPAVHIGAYDIVGISNSNEDEEIMKIIEMEKEEHFFEKNGYRAIFRAKNLEYEGGGLKVFKGRLTLSYDEYYTYIIRAKVIVLPFSTRFGLRSSGTIMDAFSQGIPIVGNPFLTMVQYHRQFPDICMLYTTIEELKGRITELMEREACYRDEYTRFQDSHSNQFIVKQIKETFR